MTEPTIWREPAIFTIGDSLRFQRRLPDYLPSDGWSIEYVLTPEYPEGSAATLTFATAPDATNTFHTVSIDNFAAGQNPGDYVLSGYLVNGTERRQLYYEELKLTPNLPAGQSTGNLKTFNERMVEKYQHKCERLAEIDIDETDVQRTRFVLQQRDKARLELGYWEARVQNDNKMRAIANTGRDPSLIPPMYAGGW